TTPRRAGRMDDRRLPWADGRQLRGNRRHVDSGTPDNAGTPQFCHSLRVQPAGSLDVSGWLPAPAGAGSLFPPPAAGTAMRPHRTLLLACVLAALVALLPGCGGSAPVAADPPAAVDPVSSPVWATDMARFAAEDAA